MHLTKTKAALEEKDIHYTSRMEDDCESIEFLFRGIPYHIWEFHDGDVWGVEANVHNTGRSEDVTGDYDSILAAEIATWPYMLG